MNPVALGGAQPAFGCSRTATFAGKFNPGQDMATALKLSAEMGNAMAMHDYGMYLVDNAKIPPLKRFMAGSLPIGIMKMKNPPDELIEAHKWFTLSEERRGNRSDRLVGNNATWLKLLNGLLTEESVKEAGRRASAWRLTNA